jgi:hypothetical protein
MKQVAYISTNGILYKGYSSDSMMELTDEEIATICKEHLAPKGCDIYTFARAILRKAQEK